ncbi:MAG: hypothetical protein M3O20_13785 [Acidobacteriota bacterium]|nr:hypothetical protein [Acidobacteriota bacterium]
MRFLSSGILLGGLLLGAAACDRPDTSEDRQAREERVDEAARKAGAEAYKAAQKTKEAAAEAAEDLRKAGREVKAGWEDAKHSDPDKSK